MKEAISADPALAPAAAVTWKVFKVRVNVPVLSRETVRLGTRGEMVLATNVYFGSRLGLTWRAKEY